MRLFLYGAAPDYPRSHAHLEASRFWRRGTAAASRRRPQWPATTPRRRAPRGGGPHKREGGSRSGGRARSRRHRRWTRPTSRWSPRSTRPRSLRLRRRRCSSRRRRSSRSRWRPEMGGACCPAPAGCSRRASRPWRCRRWEPLPHSPYPHIVTSPLALRLYFVCFVSSRPLSCAPERVIIDTYLTRPRSITQLGRTRWGFADSVSLWIIFSWSNPHWDFARRENRVQIERFVLGLRVLRPWGLGFVRFDSFYKDVRRLGGASQPLHLSFSARVPSS